MLPKCAGDIEIGCLRSWLLVRYLHNEGVVLMLIFDLVFTSSSTNALIPPFWVNIDNNPAISNG